MRLTSPRAAMSLIATGIAAVSIGLAALPASADQIRQSEYWLKTLHVTSAWTGSKGSGVTVAVLSDGVSAKQPDLAGSVTTAPAPAGAPIASGQYFGEQGTAIASLIAGHGHGPAGTAGIIGVAPQARILAVPVTLPADDPQLGQASVAAAIPAAIAAGIRYAVNHGTTVIDLPIDPGQPGTTGTAGAAAAAGGSAAERSAVAFALQHDVVLVAPAGDDGAASDAPNYPAAYHGVIAVGAFNEAFDRAVWSSHRSYVTLTAAGAGVVAASGSGYQTVNSTNAASAVVAGVAALIRARYPQLSVAQVRTALTSSTLYRRAGGLAGGFGYGAVDADKAMTAAGQLATSAAHRAGAGRRSGTGALPWRLPAASPASPGPQSVGRQILQAGEVSAGVLALLLLLIGGYAALGRRGRPTRPVAEADGTHRQAPSRYPAESPADAGPMLEFHSPLAARPEHAAGQPATTPHSDPGLFARAPALRVAPGASRPRLAPVPRRALPAGGELAREAWSGPGQTGPGQTGFGQTGEGQTSEGQASPGQAGPGQAGPGAGASRTTGPAVRASATGFAAAARSARLSGPAGRSGPGGPSGPSGPSGPAIMPGARRELEAGPSGSADRNSPAAGPADGGSWQSHGPASRAMGRRPFVSGTPPWNPAGTPQSDLPWTIAPGPRPIEAGTAAASAAVAEPRDPEQLYWRYQASRSSDASPSGYASPTFQPNVPSQPGSPDWTPRPGQSRTAGSGLPVRQPGANVPRPLSPSGSLWEPVESWRADQQDEGQDDGSRPIYVWNPDQRTGE
ncbi:MAG: S8 family serine peptidase [Streptosporangiaceae bacterium]